MKKITTLLLCGCLLTGYAAGGQVQRKTDTIPFEILHGKLIIEATINGKPARLIMDTGGVTTLASYTASHYGATVSNTGISVICWSGTPPI